MSFFVRLSIEDLHGPVYHGSLDESGVSDNADMSSLTDGEIVFSCIFIDRRFFYPARRTKIEKNSFSF